MIHNNSMRGATLPNVTQYASKAPTEYHKWFARWIVSEIGYDPDTAPSKRAAFLRGVSIATAARPAFMESEYLEQKREESGEAKRGPKPAAKKAVRKARPEPEPEEFEEDTEVEFDEGDSGEFEEGFEEETEEEEWEEEPPRRPIKKAAKKAARPAKKAARSTKDDDFLF